MTNKDKIDNKDIENNSTYDQILINETNNTNEELIFKRFDDSKSESEIYFKENYKDDIFKGKEEENIKLKGEGDKCVEKEDKSDVKEDKCDVKEEVDKCDVKEDKCVEKEDKCDVKEEVDKCDVKEDKCVEKEDKCDVKEEVDKCDVKEDKCVEKEDKCDVKEEVDKCDVKEDKCVEKEDKCDVKEEVDKCDVKEKLDKCVEKLDEQIYKKIKKGDTYHSPNIFSTFSDNSQKSKKPSLFIINKISKIDDQIKNKIEEVNLGDKIFECKCNLYKFIKKWEKICSGTIYVYKQDKLRILFIKNEFLTVSFDFYLEGDIKAYIKNRGVGFIINKENVLLMFDDDKKMTEFYDLIKM